jgi:hypothetical protein
MTSKGILGVFFAVLAALVVMIWVGGVGAQAQDFRAEFADYNAIRAVYDGETDKAVEATVDTFRWYKQNPDATLNQVFRRLERRLLRNTAASYTQLPEWIRQKREALIAANGGDETAQAVVDFDARVAALMAEVKP